MSWGGGLATAIAEFSSSVSEQLSFVPGDYVYVVVGKAYTFLEPKPSPYHTFTERVKLHVGLSQFDTMVAAMIGGFLAYLVVALREGGDLSNPGPGSPGSPGSPHPPESTDRGRSARRFFVILRRMFSAALVSAVVTVILSRISDTQFPIKVSVNDFWGALTVGFVAFFVGNRLIDRIAGLGADASPGATPPRPGNVPEPPEHNDDSAIPTAAHQAAPHLAQAR